MPRFRRCFLELRDRGRRSNRASASLSSHGGSVAQSSRICRTQSGVTGQGHTITPNKTRTKSPLDDASSKADHVNDLSEPERSAYAHAPSRRDLRLNLRTIERAQLPSGEDQGTRATSTQPAENDAPSCTPSEEQSMIRSVWRMTMAGEYSSSAQILQCRVRGVTRSLTERLERAIEFRWARGRTKTVKRGVLCR